MPPSVTVVIGEAPLTIEGLDAVARQMAAAQLSADARQRLERSYDCMMALVRASVPVYGLTTGCGPLASNGIPTARREEFQRNLIRSHAVTLGNAHPVAFVRAAMALRAHVFALGYSGVDPGAATLLVAMLNEGIHPVVREVGGVGASGDLTELAQIALAVIGEGTVDVRGTLTPAVQALRDAGLEPLVPRYREGLALINGTSFHAGAAAVLAARARRITSVAQHAAAMNFEALRGNIETFASAFWVTRPHPGQRMVAERVERLIRDSALVRSDDSAASRQDAYTLRCIPQILGAVVDALAAAAAVIETELNSVTDNPLFLVDEERVVHGGNFHGQPVAMALDQLKIGMVELGVMSERRIARILDGTLNGDLPPFLINNRAGLNSGFMGLQYCASSMVADNAVLAAPASVRSMPTNANNQDVVSMAMVAARHAARVLDNVERIVAIELLCGAQAIDLHGVDCAGAGTRATHALIREHSPPLLKDRPLSEDVEAVCRLIETDSFPR